MSWTARFFGAVLFFSFAELYLLIYVAEQMSIFFTVGMCILTGIVGGSLVRMQGIKTIQEIQATVSRGEIPTLKIISGLVLLIIGAFLLTPGFITDGIAFLLLIPPLRNGVSQFALSRYKKKSATFKQKQAAATERIINVDPKDFHEHRE